MIKIRYAELPAGLHVRTEVRGRSTIIYLLPGLSHAERRAALRRARRGADMGYGPPLPATSLAIALMRDRIRQPLRNGAAAIRAHPLLLVPTLIIVASAGLVYVLTSAVTFTSQSPQASGPYPQPGNAQASLAVPTDPVGDQGGRSPRPSGPPHTSPTPLRSTSTPGSPSRCLPPGRGAAHIHPHPRHCHPAHPGRR